jgi:hypothetical protein
MILGRWSANRKLSGFHGGISPAKSAYRKVTHYRQFILGKTEHPPCAEKREGWAAWRFEIGNLRLQKLLLADDFGVGGGGDDVDERVCRY